MENKSAPGSRITTLQGVAGVKQAVMDYRSSSHTKNGTAVQVLCGREFELWSPLPGDRETAARGAHRQGYPRADWTTKCKS